MTRRIPSARGGVVARGGSVARDVRDHPRTRNRRPREHLLGASSRDHSHVEAEELRLRRLERVAIERILRRRRFHVAHDSGRARHTRESGRAERRDDQHGEHPTQQARPARAGASNAAPPRRDAHTHHSESAEPEGRQSSGAALQHAGEQGCPRLSGRSPSEVVPTRRSLLAGRRRRTRRDTVARERAITGRRPVAGRHTDARARRSVARRPSVAGRTAVAGGRALTRRARAREARVARVRSVASGRRIARCLGPARRAAHARLGSIAREVTRARVLTRAGRRPRATRASIAGVGARARLPAGAGVRTIARRLPVARAGSAARPASATRLGPGARRCAIARPLPAARQCRAARGRAVARGCAIARRRAGARRAAIAGVDSLTSRTRVAGRRRIARRSAVAGGLTTTSQRALLGRLVGLRDPERLRRQARRRSRDDVEDRSLLEARFRLCQRVPPNRRDARFGPRARGHPWRWFIRAAEAGGDRVSSDEEQDDDDSTAREQRSHHVLDSDCVQTDERSEPVVTRHVHRFAVPSAAPVDSSSTVDGLTEASSTRASRFFNFSHTALRFDFASRIRIRIPITRLVFDFTISIGRRRFVGLRA